MNLRENWYDITRKRYDVTKVYMIFREMYCLPVIDMILREKVWFNESLYDFTRKWYDITRKCMM